MSDPVENLPVDPTEEEQPVTTEQPEDDGKTEYIEYKGDPTYGTEFLSSHTITPKQVKEAWDIEIPKTVEWRRIEGGPRKGRMLVPAAELTEEFVEGLLKDPGFRRVRL